MKATLYIIATSVAALIVYVTLRLLGVDEHPARVVADVMIGVSLGWRISALQEQVNRLNKRK